MPSDHISRSAAKEAIKAEAAKHPKGSSGYGGGVHDGLWCAIAALDSLPAAEGAERPAEILKWMRLYGELYCQLWAATETEFAVVLAGGELDHAGTMREIKRLNDNDMSNSDPAAQPPC